MAANCKWIFNKCKCKWSKWILKQDLKSLSKILFLFPVQAGRGNDDYWAEDFDKNKNCQQEEKIAKLKSEVGAHELKWDYHYEKLF